MAALPVPTTSLFTRTVVESMRTLYPERLADHSFDNTGLLLESPINKDRPKKNSVLLTIDLTRAVTSEAIQKKVSCVVAYHPIIFRGLKSLTTTDSQQLSLLRLAQEGISVYCPHTAVDAAQGGNADWLANLVAGVNEHEHLMESRDTSSLNAMFSHGKYSLSYFPYAANERKKQVKIEPTPARIRTIEGDSLDSNEGAGRLVILEQPCPLTRILSNLVQGLSKPKAMSLALPYGTSISDHHAIKSIAICAGSGGSVFSRISKIEGLGQVDVLVTGEMSHHEALAATEKGQCVVCLGHSNSERGYLSSIMRHKLLHLLPETWRSMQGRAQLAEGETHVLEGSEELVQVSQHDRDPFGTLILDE